MCHNTTEQLKITSRELTTHEIFCIPNTFYILTGVPFRILSHLNVRCLKNLICTFSTKLVALIVSIDLTSVSYNSLIVSKSVFLITKSLGHYRLDEKITGTQLSHIEAIKTPGYLFHSFTFLM